MKTMIIFKPDAVAKGLHLTIQALLLAADFEISDGYLHKMDRDDVEQLYPHGVGQPWMEDNIEFLTSDLSYFCLVQGDGCISACRRLALEFRELFQTKNPRNLMHASDSAKSAETEVKMWFFLPGVSDYDNPVQ